MATKKQLEDKIKDYEHVLHRIQMYREVTMDNNKITKLLDKICRWSYSHRCGNGENTDKEQQQLIDHAFKRMLELE